MTFDILHVAGLIACSAVGWWVLSILLPGPMEVPNERQRGDPCERCGYDLHATPDRCPECGEEYDLD